MCPQVHNLFYLYIWRSINNLLYVVLNCLIVLLLFRVFCSVGTYAAGVVCPIINVRRDTNIQSHPAKYTSMSFFTIIQMWY